MAQDNLKELKELLAFGFAVQDGLVKSLEDGDIDALDLPNLWPLIGSAGPAFNGLGNPLDRLKALTPAERQELGRYAAFSFNIPNDQLESLIERTIGWAYGAFLLGKEWAALTKKDDEEAA